MTNQSSFIRPEEFLQSVGVRAGQTVVHLGCGAGFYLIPAAKIVGKEGQAIGIDLLSDMLAEVENRARRTGVEKSIRTIRGNLEVAKGSTLEDGVADWVLIANILHQSDPEKILVEAKRITKPGGAIMIIQWNTAATPFGPPVEKRIAKDDVLAALPSLGLTVVKEVSPSPYHYGLIVTSGA